MDADGRPHLVQQWGVWVDGTLYFEGKGQVFRARSEKLIAFDVKKFSTSAAPFSFPAIR